MSAASVEIIEGVGQAESERRLPHALALNHVQALARAPHVVTGGDPLLDHPEVRLLRYGNRTGDWPYHRAPTIEAHGKRYRLLIVDGEVVVVGDGVWNEWEIPKVVGGMQSLSEQGTASPMFRRAAVEIATGLQDLLGGLSWVLRVVPAEPMAPIRPSGQCPKPPVVTWRALHATRQERLRRL